MNHDNNVTKDLNIGIAGLGNVGEGVINLLQENSELIEKKFKWASGATMDHLVFKILAFKELEFG